MYIHDPTLKMMFGGKKWTILWSDPLHQQQQIPIQTNNTTVKGVINNKIQPKRTKAMDMHFHWLCNKEAQDQFKIYWQPGRTNLADFFTKHHPPAHHVNVRDKFLE
jgi:hypothetical protein